MEDYPTYLIHYGIPNQKWGVRRFQNEDGTLTEEGLARRRKDNYKYLKEFAKNKNWSEAENRARELTNKFSDSYKKNAYNRLVKNAKAEKSSPVTIKKLEEINIDKEIENVIGKYANKIYDKRMGANYGDLLKRMEVDRLHYEWNEKTKTWDRNKK